MSQMFADFIINGETLTAVIQKEDLNNAKQFFEWGKACCSDAIELMGFFTKVGLKFEVLFIEKANKEIVRFPKD